MSKPLVSVLMPAYNAAAHLAEAIDSILAQTFSDFEFIIINDGSVDDTELVVLSYSDARIHYIKNETNSGIVTSLNIAIGAAQGSYLARMDADDISLPDRFEKQLAFMQANPDIGVCGGSIQAFGDVNDVWTMPLEHNDIVAGMLFESCLMHPSVFIKKEVLLLNKAYYREEYKFAEDYDLWLRLLSLTKLANISDVLLRYRVSLPKSTTSNYRAKQMALSEDLRAGYLFRLGIYASANELSLHNQLAFSKFELIASQLAPLREWLGRLLLDANSNLVARNSLKILLMRKYHDACFHSGQPTAVVEYLRFSYAVRRLDLRGTLRLLVKFLFKI